MTTELIEAREGGVLTLTLNRPERLNALTPGMTDALRAALRRVSGQAVRNPGPCQRYPSVLFSSRRRHTRSCLVSWARRCV